MPIQNGPIQKGRTPQSHCLSYLLLHLVFALGAGILTVSAMGLHTLVNWRSTGSASDPGPSQAVLFGGPVPDPPHQATSNKSGQNKGQLSLKQVEEFLKSKIDDETIARLIRERGVDFRLSSVALNRLLKLGAGELTKRALLEHEELAAYTAFTSEKQDPTKRLALGREFLRDYPQSKYSKEVSADLPKVMLEIFNSVFQLYSRQPEKTRLEQLLAIGQEILNEQPDRAGLVQVTTQLALATGRGMIGGFYDNLEQSRVYANQALKLLEEKTPSEGIDPENYGKLRANSLSILYQCQGLYLLRQENPDPEASLSFLTKAVEIKDGPSATDPNTYWLRAIAYDLLYQKLRDEYQALSKSQQRSARGQSLCEKINPIISQMVDEITQVLSTRGAAEASPLRVEAKAKLNSLLANDRPCLAGRIELIDEWPKEDSRYALVIGIEEYLNRNISRFNYGATDARALANVLVERAGFKPEHVILMADGEPNDRQPLRSLILQQLANLKGRIPEDGLLLVFFAAHSVERGGKAYLLPRDASAGTDALLADTALSVDRIKDLIREAQAGQVIMLLDAFRLEPLSESFIRGFTFDVRKHEVMAFATLIATGIGQRAYESTVRKQSCFTAALIDALKGQGSSGNRETTLSAVLKYLQSNVPEEARKSSGPGAEQKPQALIEGYQADELVLAIANSTSAKRARTVKPQPHEIVHAAKTIYIESQTIYLRAKLLEDELNKLPDFQSLGLKIVKNKAEADLLVEVTLPFLTWMWTFNVKPQANNTVLASAKIREALASSASPRLARELTTRLQTLRSQDKSKN